MRQSDRVAAVVQQRTAEERHDQDAQPGQHVGQVPVAGRPDLVAHALLGHAATARATRSAPSVATTTAATRSPTRVRARGRAGWCRRPRDPGGRRGPRPRPSRRPTRRARRRRSPIRSSARSAVSCSTRSVTCSTRARISSSSSLPSNACRLGAVLVGVAEDAGDVEPGGDQEVAEGLQVVLGLAGEADDHVGADAGARGEGADLVEQPEEALGVAEPAHPPQHRRRWRAGRTGRSSR